MFARVFSLAFCLVAAPCFAETVTYDFTTMDRLPDWFDLESGTLTEEGLINFPGNSQYNHALAIGFRLDRPFTIDQVVFSGANEVLSPNLFMACDPPPHDVLKTDAPNIADYDCMSFNGRGMYTLFAEYRDGEGDDPNLAIVYSMTVSTFDPVPVVLGDTDYDADVDLQDLNNVRNNFSQSPLYAFGDADHDGSINLEDLNAVRNNFGSSVPVPEPSSLTLLLFALIRAPQILRRGRLR